MRLVWRNTFFVLDFLLYFLYSIIRLKKNFKSFSCQCFNEKLHLSIIAFILDCSIQRYLYEFRFFIDVGNTLICNHSCVRAQNIILYGSSYNFLFISAHTRDVLFSNRLKYCGALNIFELLIVFSCFVAIRVI